MVSYSHERNRHGLTFLYLLNCLNQFSYTFGVFTISGRWYSTSSWNQIVNRNFLPWDKINFWLNQTIYSISFYIICSCTSHVHFKIHCKVLKYLHSSQNCGNTIKVEPARCLIKQHRLTVAFVCISHVLPYCLQKGGLHIYLCVCNLYIYIYIYVIYYTTFKTDFLKI